MAPLGPLPEEVVALHGETCQESVILATMMAVQQQNDWPHIQYSYTLGRTRTRLPATIKSSRFFMAIICTTLAQPMLDVICSRCWSQPARSSLFNTLAKGACVLMHQLNALFAARPGDRYAAGTFQPRETTPCIHAYVCNVNNRAKVEGVQCGKRGGRCQKRTKCRVVRSLRGSEKYPAPSTADTTGSGDCHQSLEL